MERLTKTCSNGTHRAADTLPCGENSWDYKTLLLERLGAYEDTGLAPEEILTGAQLAEIACMQIRFKKMQELLERAAEEIENCYGMEMELTEAMRKQLI